MLNFGPFKTFLFIYYIRDNENPPITDEICWSLDIRYCGASLYILFPEYISKTRIVQWRHGAWFLGKINESLNDHDMTIFSRGSY